MRLLIRLRLWSSCSFEQLACWRAWLSRLADGTICHGYACASHLKALVVSASRDLARLYARCSPLARYDTAIACVYIIETKV